MRLPEENWYPILESHKVRRKPLGFERLGLRLDFWRTADGQPCAETLRRTLLIAACVLGISAASVAFADNPVPAAVPTLGESLTNDSLVAPRKIEPDLSAQIEANKSYAIPALEIFGFDFLLNQYNRNFISDEYKSDLSSIRHNLRSSWRVDNDPFLVNQLGHPYQGSIYHGLARSSGLNYWESLGYTFVGSAFWEVAGETVPPSRNDQITTGVGGSFLGEELYRMANLVLERDDIRPFWRELGAAVISPSTGFNRLAFGDRFDTIFASRNPAYYSRLQIGFSGTARNGSGFSTTRLKRNEGLIDFSMDYGLPGKPGYRYTRPFDYFNFQVTASSANGFENMMTRGLLIGKEYEAGENYRGVWGLYGSYDYIAPQIFRVSSTAVSLGTTGQWWLSKSVALQGTALLGAGYAAVGTTRSTSDTDYHYGVAPQALLAMRLIFGNKASFDLTAREYFVSGVGAADRDRHDNIARIDASITVPIHGRHAITLKYLGNRRDASYSDIGDSTQSRATVGLFYTLVGHDGFGAVDWR